MALFGEKYGETVRTITIMAPGADIPAEGTATEAAVQPSAASEQQRKYSYELCGGTHLERTSDVGTFLIVSEGSAAAGVRRIEAVTGRGAYALVARRFKLLERTAGLLKASVEELPLKVEALQEEAAELRRDLATVRRQQALTAFSDQLSRIQQVGEIGLLTVELPNADIETLRSLGDRFREEHPKRGVAMLATGTTLIAVVTDDLVKAGMKAADLIAAVGGRGGGRPNLAQGSVPAGTNVGEALRKTADAIGARAR